jgi:hypothetical protein
MRVHVAAISAALFLGLAPAGEAATFDAPIQFAQAGAVDLTLDFSSGGYDHLLYLGPSFPTLPPVPTPLMALTDTGNPSPNVLGFTPANLGDTISLGSFGANQELLFRLVNVESSRLGTPGTLAGSIYSGSLSSSNPGPFFTLIEEPDPFTRIVHFEDLFPPSSADETAFLNGRDVQFTLTLTPVPVPAALWLFGSGVIGLAAVARRMKA